MRPPGRDRRRARADARADRARDRAPARRRPARRRARRAARRRGAQRPAAPVRDRRRGRGAGLRARGPAGRRGRRSSRRSPTPACPALVATSAAAGRPLLCAVVDAAAAEPIGTARRARAALTGGTGRNGVRAAASRAAPVGSLRRAFHEARCALEATVARRRRGARGRLAPGPGRLHPAARAPGRRRPAPLQRRLLEPIERTEGEYGGELLRSLEAFIENNGNWERAARQLYCHRHTLRYRIRKIEELTGRDLAGRRTGSSSGWHYAQGSWSDDRVGVPDRGEAGRVPGRDHADRRPRALRARARRPDPGGRRRGLARSPTPTTRPRARGSSPTAEDVFAEAEMVLGVKEPQPQEVPMLREGQTLFTYLHLAPAPGADPGASATRARPASPTRRSRTAAAGCRCWRRCRRSPARSRPRRAPSCSRSRWAAAGSCSAASPASPPANVMVIGGGAVGMHAAFIAIGMEADVFVYDVSLDKLRELDVAFGGRASTVFSSTLRSRRSCPTWTW